MPLPGSHCALFLQWAHIKTTAGFLPFFFLRLSNISLCKDFFYHLIRIRKRKEGTGRKLCCWLCRFCLSGTPVSRIHHALMLIAVTNLHRPHPDQPTSQIPSTLSPVSRLANIAKETWHRNELKLMTLMSFTTPLPMSAIITAAPASGSKLLFFTGKLQPTLREQVLWAVFLPGSSCVKE